MGCLFNRRLWYEAQEVHVAIAKMKRRVNGHKCMICFAGQKRPPRRKSVQPKAPTQYEVDTANASFSSSQQMRENGMPSAVISKPTS